MAKSTESTEEALERIMNSKAFQEAMGNVQAAEPSRPNPSAEANTNSAVARCTSAFEKAYKEARANGNTDHWASEAGAKAYRQSLPPLSGSENVREFIACIAHGMLIDAIPGADGTRLLYAAQIAHTTSQVSVPRYPGRPRKEVEPVPTIPKPRITLPVNQVLNK